MLARARRARRRGSECGPAAHPPVDAVGGSGSTRRQSRTVPSDILDTRTLRVSGDGKVHDQPDIVMVEPVPEGDIGLPPSYRVTLVEVACALEHRVAAVHAAKRERYAPRPGALARGYLVPELVVVVVCVRGSIPASSAEALKALGINRGPAMRLLARASNVACDYVRRLCHTRRSIESATMGSHGIITRLVRANGRFPTQKAAPGPPQGPGCRPGGAPRKPTPRGSRRSAACFAGGRLSMPAPPLPPPLPPPPTPPPRPGGRATADAV